jgi:hypothetical protein
MMFWTLTLHHGFAVVLTFEHFACGLLFTAADCFVIASIHKAKKLSRMLFELS